MVLRSTRVGNRCSRRLYRIEKGRLKILSLCSSKLRRVATSAVIAGLLLGGAWTDEVVQAQQTAQPVATGHEPGALVAVSINSTVAVLLDELPASQRSRVANAMIAKPASFWVARAKKQVDHTNYRLTYRQYYYANHTGTGTREMMPLPPQSQWNVALNAPAARGTWQGHDVVMVPFTLTTTVLTSENEPKLVEPHLNNIGGTHDELFALPLDPELVFQRTGYACMDESGYPPNTVDGVNASQLYDDFCSNTGVGTICHVTEPFPTESCIDAVTNHIGRVDATLHFERIAWSDAVANQVRITGYTQPTADLQPLASALQDNRVIYRYIAPNSCAVQEQCVGGSGWRRLLQFTASVKNTGAAAMVAGSVDPSSPFIQHNNFELSECHEHYHFSHYATFAYGSLPGEKRAFCLESTQRHFNSETTPWSHPYSCDNQGIESGWGDDYIAGIECQWIDVTTARAGTQNLTFQSNPDRFLCEGTPVTDSHGNQLFEPTEFTTEDGEPVDRPMCTFPAGALDNNFAQTPVTLPAAGGYTLSACTRGETGPVRDCGWRETPVRSCTPGSTVTLSCSPRRSTDPMQAVRVCEASTTLGGTSCVYREALANTSVDGSTQVSFTCPAARDATETGGRYSLYFAPVVDGDDAATVNCN
jgi:Lysyl oxidase